MVAQLIELPSKGPGSRGNQFYLCEFESWPRGKVVGKILVGPSVGKICLRIRKKKKNLSTQVRGTLLFALGLDDAQAGPYPIKIFST